VVVAFGEPAAYIKLTGARPMPVQQRMGTLPKSLSL
jgi:hypothetical protein